MGVLRRTILTALPKFLVSRTTGALARIPIPRWARGPIFRGFARRYGANLEEMVGSPADYRSMSAFFRRALVEGARPLDPDAPLVWPCDGKVITTGSIEGGRITQVKGQDYSVAQLLQDSKLAEELATGHQATVYLAPGDYHRVHSPFAGELLGTSHIRGALFPVNPGAVDSIPELFPRNERVVFRFRLPEDSTAVVVMVSALNVGDTKLTAAPGPVHRGAELGQFGFGSTTITLVSDGSPSIPELPRGQVVRCRAAMC